MAPNAGNDGFATWKILGCVANASAGLSFPSKTCVEILLCIAFAKSSVLAAGSSCSGAKTEVTAVSAWMLASSSAFLASLEITGPRPVMSSAGLMLAVFRAFGLRRIGWGRG